MPYALRVDGHDCVPSLVAWLGNYGGYLVVRERGDGAENPHVHAYIDSEVEIRIVRQSFNRKFPAFVGNGKYSLTKVDDEDKYLRYMCKGEDAEHGPDVAGMMGVRFTDAWIAETHRKYWEVAQQVREAQQRRKRSVFEVVFDECVKEGVRWSEDEVIAKKYIRETAAAGKGINLFAVRSQVNLLKVRLCPDDSAIEELSRYVAGKN